MSRIRFLLPLVVFAGCAGQIKMAAIDHAKSSQTVAASLNKAATMIKCDAMPADKAEFCTAAVALIQDQAKSLNTSAETLTQAAK